MRFLAMESRFAEERKKVIKPETYGLLQKPGPLPVERFAGGARQRLIGVWAEAVFGGDVPGSTTTRVPTCTLL